MIKYNNKNHVYIIFQWSGSVIPKCLPVGICTFSLGLALAILRKKGKTKELFGEEEYIRDSFSCQVMAVVLGYLLVVRTNMALSRWMEGIGEIQQMTSKWTDAFNSINGFWAGKTGTPQLNERILHARVRIAHWFSLMSCIAFATLRSGKELSSLDDLPIKAIFPFEDQIRKKTSFTANSGRPTQTSFTANKGSSRDSAQSLGLQNNGRLSRKESRQLQEIASLDLSVLHAPTSEEVDRLTQVEDKVALIGLWIIQATMVEIRAGSLDAAPPILSRIYQQLSAGMLGFHQAHKVAMVPFPFPFAQMVSYILLMFYSILPFYIDVFTASLGLTPIISFILPMAYCCLNRIGVELEEPFGTDRNDVDIDERHEAFIHILDDVLKHSTTPPVTASMTMEKEILQGCQSKVLPYDRSGYYEPGFLSNMRMARQRTQVRQPGSRETPTVMA